MRMRRGSHHSSNLRILEGCCCIRTRPGASTPRIKKGDIIHNLVTTCIHYYSFELVLMSPVLGEILNQSRSQDRHYPQTSHSERRRAPRGSEMETLQRQTASPDDVQRRDKTSKIYVPNICRHSCIILGAYILGAYGVGSVIFYFPYYQRHLNTPCVQCWSTLHMQYTFEPPLLCQSQRRTVNNDLTLSARASDEP